MVSRRYFTHVSRTCNEANQQSRLPQSDKRPKIPLTNRRDNEIHEKFKSKFHGSLTLELEKKKKKKNHKRKLYVGDGYAPIELKLLIPNYMIVDGTTESSSSTRKKKKEVEKR